MARPRTHDEQAARQGALHAFLRGGYDGTSLADLEAATKLDRRQLYNQHGDKRGVFLRALDDFIAAAAEQFLSKLEAPGAGLAAIRSTLNGMVKIADTEQGRMGCLVCNTSREAITREDDVVFGKVSGYFDRIESAYADSLARAVSDGDVDLSRRARQRAARHLLGTHVAMCVLARSGAAVEVIRDVADVALQAITAGKAREK
ncbi:MAG: TetR/AcrR family transcriptional regulator [Planctomycetota bacterium]